MTRLRRMWVITAAVAVMVLGGGIAYASVAAVSAGPPVTSPPGIAGPYYSGPVHECVSDTNESVAYTELHSTAVGNCAAGYRQLVMNELTPAFTLTLGMAGGSSTAYNCTASTAQPETSIACTAPSPSPTASSSTSPG